MQGMCNCILKLHGLEIARGFEISEVVVAWAY